MVFFGFNFVRVALRSLSSPILKRKFDGGQSSLSLQLAGAGSQARLDSRVVPTENKRQAALNRYALDKQVDKEMLEETGCSHSGRFNT